MLENTTSNATILVCQGLYFVEFKNSPQVEQIALATAVVAFFASVIATLGNGLIFYTITAKSSLQSASNTLIAALSLTDLFVGLLALPLFGAVRIYDYFNIHVCVFKRIFTFVIASGSGMSIIVVPVISIDRYILVLHSSKYQEWHLKTKYKVVLFCLWLAWISFASLCVFVFVNGKVMNIGIVILIVSCLVTPAFCYTGLLMKIRRQDRRIADVVDVDIRNARKRERRRSVTVFIIIFVLILGYIPKLFCLIAVPRQSSTFELSYQCNRVSHLLLMLTSTLNPYIYCNRIKNIRIEVDKNVRKLLKILVTDQNVLS